MQIAKENEWWIRQKYKLMKALKIKWAETRRYQKKSNYLDEPYKNTIRNNSMNKNDFNISSISFEKIPLLRVNSSDIEK
jgi:hypothetical protein